MDVWSEYCAKPSAKPSESGGKVVSISARKG
jgi:hypothetical protein